MGGPFKNALCSVSPGHPNYPNRGCIRRTGHEGPHRNAVHEWDSCAWMAPLWKRGDPTKWNLYDGERHTAASGDSEDHPSEARRGQGAEGDQGCARG